jgi:hypothetical protein
MMLFRCMLVRYDIISSEYIWEAHLRGFTCVLLYEKKDDSYHYTLAKRKEIVYNSLSFSQGFKTFEAASKHVEEVITEKSEEGKWYR